MARLYPPQLEGALPAFYKTYSDDKKQISCVINIPFGINRAVNIKAIDKLALRLRTTSTNTYIVADKYSTNYDAETNIASFKFDYDADDENTDVTASLINEGQYYRVQLAFVQDDIIGYYSTVGIIKCVAKPTVYINGFSKDEINQFDNTFLGVYQQNTEFGDSTEKAYSYKFELFDKLGNLILDSGEQIHDITEDTLSDSSNDIWVITQELDVGEIYKLRYTVTTLNGLKVSTIDYQVMRAIPVEPEYDIKLYAEANIDEGYIDIYLEGETDKDEDNYVFQLIDIDADYNNTLVYYVKVADEFIEYEPDETLDADSQYFAWASLRSAGRMYIKVKSTIIGEKACSGNFLITRACSKDNFFEWIEITRFTISSSFPSEYHFYDYTVEQGIQYRYALQQFNVHNIYSRKIPLRDKYGNTKATVTADFEDMFLSDGVRQLKIKFNPKVASFKNTIPEQKIETIGNKYPFIFRNGSVCYKEFPISGLISFQTDNAMLFLNDKELREAGILELKQYRDYSNKDNYSYITGHDATRYKYQTLKLPAYFKDINGQIKLVGYRNVVTEYNTRRLDIKYIDKSKHFTHYNSNGNKVLDDKVIYEEIDEIITQLQEKKPENLMIRRDLNLTSENISGERYFKLKVLDWLTDGKVKLFRSGTEGNYLVRLLNVSLTPQDPLGRMLHTFTCTAYEIDELNYTNLVQFGIVNPTVSSNYESQWASVDIHQLLQSNTDTDNWIKISPEGITIDAIDIQDFAPGDQIKIVYDSGPDGVFSIGVTGNLELNNDDRTIIEVYIKPNKDVESYNDFSRSFLYRTTSLQLTKFDAITDFKTYPKVCEQFIGPIDNLLEPFMLRDNVYGIRNEDGVVLEPLNEIQAFHNVYTDLKAHHRLTYRINEKAEKWTGLNIDILHVTKKNIIPIYLYTYRPNNVYENKFGITPFGIPYVNATNINKFINNRRTAIMYVDGDIIYQDEDGNYVRADGVNIEDIVTILDDKGITYSSYDLLEPYFFYEPTQTWVSFKDYPSIAPIQVGYYDLAKKEWWNKDIVYDPTFSINELDEFPEIDSHGDFIKDNTLIGDNNISLLEIGDITLYNLGELDSLRIGNGIVAEVTVQMHIVDYEIEDTDPATKEWKEAYLTSKNSLDPLIDTAMLHIDELNDAEKEYAKLLAEIQEIEEQIKLYEQGTNATEGVMAIASTRLVSQKKKLWFNLEKQIEDILNILKEQKVYADINATIQRDALTNYYYNTALAEEEDFFDPENPKQLSAINELYLYENPNERETILLNNINKTFKIISEAYLFYAPEYEKRQQNAQNIINKCDSQLMSLAAQRGNIVGGYLEDYDEEHLPPENTLVAIQYQIALINKEIEEAKQHIIDIESKYINKLLESVIFANNQTIGDVTDTYIQDNAKALSAMLNKYITDLTQSKTELLNADSTRDVAAFDNKIATLQAQKELLDTIAINSGNQSRENDSIINTIEEEAKNSSYNNKTIYEKIIEIRDTYLNTVTPAINNKLANIGTLESILRLKNDANDNEKVLAILNILVDQYNTAQASTVTKYLNEYFYNTKIQTPEDVIELIRNAEATYAAQLKALNAKLTNYQNEEHKFETQINEIQKTVESIEQTKASALADYNQATEALSIGLATQSFQDSEGLINRIINNQEHQGNVQLAIDYLNWLESTQDNLLDQIGQIFANLETAKDYAAMMLDFINAYEEEAFNLLHQYDALEVDLQQGFYGENGIDWLYYQPDKYWLSSYKDIFFLIDGELDETWISRLSDNNEEVRTTAYQELKNNLMNKLLDRGITLNLSILADTSQHYRLVQIVNTNGDQYYPDVYELSDVGLSNPIELNNNQFLLPDTISYNIYDCELRPVEMVEISDGVFEYRKNPRAAGYYTNKSDLYHLVEAFDKDISLVTDAEFAEAAANAAANNAPLQWLTTCPPVSISINLHSCLFDTYTYSTIAKTITDDSEVLNITPNYHQFFNRVLGSIVHDYKGNSEYASWMGLKELDQQILSELASYFTSYAIYNNLSLSNNTSIEEYSRLSGLAREMETQLNRYKGIALECRTVLASYDAQKVDPDSSEYQQLLILLETAEEEISYYTEQKAMYDSQLEKMLNEDIDFKEYTIYAQTLPDSKRYIMSLINDYDEQYSLYKKKVEHYLYLLFNNEPYGHYIDRTVVINQDILQINGNDTSMYNFGIAYALEAYKRNKDSDEPINFTTLLESIDDINELFNNNFDFVFPIPHYTKVASNAVYNGTNSYYYLNDNNQYEYYPYQGAENWQEAVANNRIYLHISPENYSNQKSYYIKEDNKFTPYRYIDEPQWQEDRDKLDIYYTYYPSLIDFAIKEEYRPLNLLDNYSPTETYYTQSMPNEYTETTITPENWQLSVMSNNVYIKVGNGGLKGFLKNLLASSNYVNNIKNNYLGTLNLYISLLAQSLGDTSSLDNLRLLQAKDITRQKELEEILKYKDANFIDIDSLIDEIYQNLTYYLISLTNAYINLVERSYEAV